MQTGHIKKFLEMIFGWPSLSLEFALGSRYALLTGVTEFLIATATAGCYGEAMGSPLLPLLDTLSAFLAAFMVALVGMAWPPLAATLALPMMKVPSTTSSPEACRVAPWWFLAMRG
jgi:hypothetical protein